MPTSPKIAIVCDWLTNWGGAERCLMAVHEIWPEAPIYTLIYNEEKMPEFKDADIRTSYINRLPLAKKKWQFFLKSMPFAIEQFDLTEYDIVISMSHVVAKGVITKPSALHVCYLYSPTRYMWDYSHLYLKEIKFSGIAFIDSLLKQYVKKQIHHLRQWDTLASQRPDYIVSISDYIARRTQKYYRRESDVIYPPVDLTKYSPSQEVKDFYLVVGRQSPYKKTDIVIEAFNQMQKPLVVIGDGPELKKLIALAGPSVQILGRLSDAEVAKYYRECRGFVFPQEEDFGITPLEAQASGRPVIAYRAGGALETVVENETGIFFNEQTPEAIIQAVEQFEQKHFDVSKIRKHAETFDTEIFKKNIKQYIEEKYQLTKQGKETLWK